MCMGSIFHYRKGAPKWGGSVFIFVVLKVVFLANGKLKEEWYATKNVLHPNGSVDDRLQQVFSRAFLTAYLVENIV